jgi:hypothetical protein
MIWPALRKTKPGRTDRRRAPNDPWLVELVSAEETSQTVSLQVPAGFELGETSMVLKAIEKPGLHDPRLLQKQTTIRPNLLVKRTWGPSPELTQLAADLSQYLTRTVPGIMALETGDFRFSDDVAGYKASFEFQPMPKIRLKQVHVLRVDAEGAMHFTLTVGVDAHPSVIEQYLACIAATRLGP